MAEHSLSDEHVRLKSGMSSKLLQGSGKYSPQDIEKLQKENEGGAEFLDDGDHTIYGVALGQKPLN